MSKYLIFRTDRIGDYVFSRIITQSILDDNKKNQIDIISSKYNSNYIKKYKDINKVYILDKWDLVNLISTAIKINNVNYDYLIVLDSKRRSIFFSTFLKSKYKIAILKDFRPFLILKLFFNKYFINTEFFPQLSNFKTLINYLDCKIPQKINYYKDYKFKKNIFNLKKDYFLIHLDEKWFDGYYYSDYDSIDLNIKNFDKLIKFIKNNFRKKIVISTGKIKVNLLKEIINHHFNKINKNVFYSKKYKKNLIFFENTDFQDIENLVKNSSYVLCCEGAVSHISHIFKKKTYALVNKKHINTAKFWTDHMNEIYLINRNNISKICKSIKSYKQKK